MKVVIAPDSFKESLTAGEVAAAIGRGWKRVFPEHEVIECPIADGGEGTLDALAVGLGAEIREVQVTAPAGNRVTARFGVAGKLGIVEMAEGAGLGLVPVEGRRPMELTSRGTGELIQAALDAGCDKVIIGLGGSATTDGGLGALQALGFRFFDDAGKDIPEGGAGLCAVERYEAPDWNTEVILAADVTSRLEEAALYIEQKGAQGSEISQLQKGFYHFGEKLKEWGFGDLAQQEGAGAAGGMGAGFAALLGGKLQSGFQVIAETLKLRELFASADLVITGEGSINHQTIHGKALVGIAKLAEGTPVIALAGSLRDDWHVLHKRGIGAAMSVIQKPADLQECMRRGAEWLEEGTEQVARTIQIGQQL